MMLARLTKPLTGWCLVQPLPCIQSISAGSTIDIESLSWQLLFSRVAHPLPEEWGPEDQMPACNARADSGRHRWGIAAGSRGVAFGPDAVQSDAAVYESLPHA